MTAREYADPDEFLAMISAAMAIVTDPERRFDLAGQQEAAELLSRADLTMPWVTAEIRDSVLNMLGGTLANLFELTHDRQFIKEAVDVLSRAAAGGDPYALANLGDALRTRFEHLGDPADLEQAVSVTRRALAGELPPVERAGLLSNLGVILQVLFVVGSRAHLDEAIEAGEAALREAPRAAERPEWPSNLANTYSVAYLATGERSYLDRAIDLMDLVVGRPDVLGRQPTALRAAYLSNLGGALGQRFGHVGDRADLDRAVQTFRDAVRAAGGSADRAGHHSNLGQALIMRFNHFGDLEDIDEAVRATEEAVAASPPGHVGHGVHLSAMATARVTRFQRTGALADLDAAITTELACVSTTGPEHLDRPGWLSNLGASLTLRFERTGDPVDIDAAIRYCTEAVATAGPAHPMRSRYLGNLANAQRRKALHSGRGEDASATVASARAASDPLPADPARAAVALKNLGAALAVRFGITGDESDRLEAAWAHRRAAGVRAAPTPVRATSAMGAGEIFVAAGNWPAALECLAEAVSLVVRLAGQRIARSSRQSQLARFNGAVRDAAAAAIETGDPYRAVALLEQGRAVLLAQSLQSRQDLTRVRTLRPDLADRFSRIGALLDADNTGRLIQDPRGADPVTDLRHRLADEWEETVARIRALPGLGGFLQPPEIGAILPAPGQGTIVLVNVSRFRSDALLLDADGVDLLPLPTLGVEAVRERAEALSAATDPSTHDGLLTETLEWLWQHVTGPVIDRLALRADRPARVWWVPTGPLVALPLHASGCADQPGRSVHEQVVSSYLPTAAALRAYRSGESVTPPRAVRAPVVVAVADSPHGAFLSAPAETTKVWESFAGTARVLVDGEATVDGVLAALADSEWAHLICHGFTNPADPSESYLALTGGDLTVRQLIGLNRQDAHLAYLSACSTATAGDVLPDEVIHLSSAFHLAGFRHVIGTLWPVTDRVALTMADAVYTSLHDTPPAEAVHRAVTALRRRYARRPRMWAAHVHIGP
ncbi:CHAT domain-containing tetratricopeptide repeat protein [Micromonospora sp. NBC_01796]|uniref:CHAT domain-containing tetratricopeptide repeat protein n=1 Tax=Micromonospora sp. NBC_01796 TaxID=2975987 RepID=UPI002DD9F930|nr:CHAT domain-containing protein [Micromonospora sp. NBC_01796]WSA86665.1 CHAT domain-containing protein [Micromonospora sp. NBC_01796]